MTKAAELRCRGGLRRKLRFRRGLIDISQVFVLLSVL
jgi:hypothetical protein